MCTVCALCQRASKSYYNHELGPLLAVYLSSTNSNSSSSSSTSSSSSSSSSSLSGKFVHMLCARASSLSIVIPSSISAAADHPTDIIYNLPTVIQRAAHTLCASCGNTGASVGCTHASCTRMYHVTCAMEASLHANNDQSLWDFDRGDQGAWFHCSKH